MPTCPPSRKIPTRASPSKRHAPTWTSARCGLIPSGEAYRLVSWKIEGFPAIFHETRRYASPEGISPHLAEVHVGACRFEGDARVGIFREGGHVGITCLHFR